MIKPIERILQLPPRMRMVLGGGVLIVLLLLIYPFQTTVVPVWDLQVIDEQGLKVAGINVTQHWQHNLLESIGHAELQKTNDDGRVVFPRRTIRANVISRISSFVGKITSKGSRAKFNRYSSVVVWGSDMNQTNVAVYEGEGVPPSQVVCTRVGP